MDIADFETSIRVDCTLFHASKRATYTRLVTG